MAANLAPISSLVGEAADLRGMRECLQWFTREKQWINDIHLQLCRVPAPTFLEQQRAEWIVAQFRNLGWEAHIDRAGNVVATPDAHSEGPYVALTAHLDTVLAPRVEGRYRHGAGRAFSRSRHLR
jgi:tripeptide aminopeptidase